MMVSMELFQHNLSEHGLNAIDVCGSKSLLRKCFLGRCNRSLIIKAYVGFFRGHLNNLIT